MDAGKALYVSTLEVVMEYLESDRSRVWAALTRAGMEAWLGWLAVVLNLDQNRVLQCSLPKTDRRLLLMGRDAEAQTKQNDFLVMDGQSSRYFFIITRRSECTRFCHSGLASLCTLQWGTKEAVEEGTFDERNVNFADLRVCWAWVRAARR